MNDYDPQEQARRIWEHRAPEDQWPGWPYREIPEEEYQQFARKAKIYGGLYLIVGTALSFALAIPFAKYVTGLLEKHGIFEPSSQSDKDTSY